MSPGRSRGAGRGLLPAILLAVPAAPAAWALVRAGLPVGPAGVVGFALSEGVCLALYGPRTARTWVSFGASAVFGWIGLLLGYVHIIRLENAAYGCSFSEALEILPEVLLSPNNLASVLTDHLMLGFGLLLVLLLVLVGTRGRRK